MDELDKVVGRLKALGYKRVAVDYQPGGWRARAAESGQRRIWDASSDRHPTADDALAQLLRRCEEHGPVES